MSGPVVAEHKINERFAQLADHPPRPGRAEVGLGREDVVYVVGAQKVVRDLGEGLKRIYEYSYPNKDRRIMQAFGIHSFVSKILIIKSIARSPKVASR